MEFRGKIYEGDLPYIFISYSHLDADRVNPIIRQLQSGGFRIWYDSGIEAGEEWPAYIAAHLKKCGCFIPFLTANYMRSDNCRQELHYALQKKRNLLPVYLEQVELSEGLDMQLSPIQALMYYGGISQERFVGQLTHAAIMQPCLDQDIPDEDDNEPKDESHRNWKVGSKPAPKPNPKPNPKPGKGLLLAGAAVVLAAVIGIAVFGGGKKEKLPEKQEVMAVVQATEEIAAANVSLEQGSDVEIVNEIILENTLMTNEMSFTAENKDDNEAESNEKFFGMDVARKDVGTLTFLNTIADAPSDATDVSMLRNGKVKAWAVKNGELYDVLIAAEGGVFAPADSGNLLRNLSNATEIDFSGFHTENVQNMQSLLGENAKLETLDVSAWNTAQVKNMAGLFSNCRSLKKVDVSRFDTSNVTDMSHMFRECASLTELDVSGFDTGRVTNMYSMFYNWGCAETLDVSKFNTSSVDTSNPDNYSFFMNEGVKPSGKDWKKLFS